MADDSAPPPGSSIGGDYVAGDKFVTQTAGGDIVGRDKIVNHIQHIYERALSAAEVAEREQAFERQRLAEGVTALVQRLQARVAQAPPAGSPYKGLLEYRLADAEDFFGRERAVAELLDHLARAPLTVLHSESGAGKTSLLQAGLAPRLLAQGHLPLILRAYNVEPGYALKRACLADPGQAPLLAAAPLREFVRQVCGVLGPATKLIVCLDQFEEFFTQLDEPARDEFVRDLSECLDDESLNTRWLLALRTEYFGGLAAFRPRVRNPFDNDCRLGRLGRGEAQEVILRPAERRGLTFEPGLVDWLLDQLGKNSIAPPELQLVCTALTDDLGPDERTVTWARLDREDGVAGILRGHLERVLGRDLPAGQRPAARRLLEALISSEQQRLLRLRADLVAELEPHGVTALNLDLILAQLVDSRLLKADETEAGLAFELAHDYLLAEVRLDPEVQARKAAQELLEQEVRAYRRHHTLLSPDRLKVIEPYQAELRLDSDAQRLLSESQAAALAGQRAEEQRRQRELDDARRLAQETEARRQAEAARAREAEQAAVRLRGLNRGIAIVGALALVGAVVAGVLGFASRQNATLARHNEGTAVVASTQSALNLLTAQAAITEAVGQRGRAESAEQLSAARLLSAQGQNVFADQPLLGVRLALEGLAQVPPGEEVARSQLAQSVLQLLGTGRVQSLGNDVAGLWPSPSGTFVVVQRAGQLSELRRTADGALLATLGDGAIYQAEFSRGPAEAYLLVVYPSTVVEVYRTADGQRVLSLGQVDYERNVFFSPDPGGTYLVVLDAALDGGGEVWRTADGTRLYELPQDAGDVAFSPDDNAAYLVVSSLEGSPQALLRTRDGAPVALSGPAASIDFSPGPQPPAFVVRYLDDRPGEIRRGVDGAVLASLPAGLDEADFRADPSRRYYVLIYGGGRRYEVRRAADHAVVTAVESDVAGGAYRFSPDPQASYFVLAQDPYTPQARLQVYRTLSGERVLDLSGPIGGYDFSTDSQAAFLAVDQGPNWAPGLYRLAGGATVASGEPLAYVSFHSGQSPPDVAPHDYFVVGFRNGGGELVHVQQGPVGELFGGVAFAALSPDDHYVVLRYSDRPGDLRRTSDGGFVARLSGIPAEVLFPGPSSQVFFIRYQQQLPEEIRRTSDGALIATLPLLRSSELGHALLSMAVAISPDPAAAYGVVALDSGVKELWELGAEPRQLADLGLGLSDKLFDPAASSLLTVHGDGRAYRLDLALLARLRAAGPSLTPEQVLDLACAQLFSNGAFDLALLDPYLNGRPLRACMS